jgi:hypothetical protein
MDVRTYYRRIAELEASIEAKDVMVVSLDTPDGGKAGVFTEAPKRVACQLVVEGRAKLATEVEALDYRRRQRDAKKALDNASAMSRVQISLVPEQDLKALRSMLKPGRKGEG